MEGHEMHAEWMEISALFIEELRTNITAGIFCVGTTSLRTIESIYWMGVKALMKPGISIDELAIKQWEVYENPLLENKCSSEKALNALLQFLKENKTEKLLIQTQIIIVPGLSIQTYKGNSHQFSSAKIHIVIIGCSDGWKGMEKNLRICFGK